MTEAFLATLMALALQASPGAATPAAAASTSSVVRIPPDWSARPSALDIERVVNRYGPNGFSGVITLRARCLITVAGVATRCEVLHQSFPDYNFGPLVDALAAGLPFQPATEAGVPVEDWIVIPLRFNMTVGSRNDRRHP